MAIDREMAALDNELRQRDRAPETSSLESLLWALAELQSDQKRHEAVGRVAGTVGDWARRGRNLNGPEILVVLEAALKGAGATL